MRETAYLLNPPYVTASKRLRVRPDGSLGLDFVPTGLNRWLFDHSRLYETLVLLWGQREPAAPERLDVRYEHLKALVDAAGGKLVIYFAGALDRPFAELTRERPESDVVQFATDRAIPLYRLAEQLIGEDYLALRLDPFGHFNAAGHELLARRFEQIVMHDMPAGGHGE